MHHEVTLAGLYVIVNHPEVVDLTSLANVCRRCLQ